MAWYDVQLTVSEQEVVNNERESHPQSHVRRKMLVLWLLHCGLTRATAATVAGLGRAAVQTAPTSFRPTSASRLQSPLRPVILHPNPYPEP
jgi:hypothetical protein